MFLGSSRFFSESALFSKKTAQRAFLLIVFRGFSTRHQSVGIDFRSRHGKRLGHSKKIRRPSRNFGGHSPNRRRSPSAVRAAVLRWLGANPSHDRSEERRVGKEC